MELFATRAAFAYRGTASYTGNKGTDLQTITYANISDPEPACGPIPLRPSGIQNQ